MMKEHPIIFGGPMVRALVEGRKTMTRRVVKTPKNFDWFFCFSIHDAREAVMSKDKSEVAFLCGGDQGYEFVKCPYGVPGDRLWVKESIRKGKTETEYGSQIEYCADGAVVFMGNWIWKRSVLPSIFLPYGLHRITLEVVDVRVERVQEITVDDVNEEGIACSDCWPQGEPYMNFPRNENCACVNKFRNLWDDINKKRGLGWEANPYVWAIEFKRVEVE